MIIFLYCYTIVTLYCFTILLHCIVTLDCYPVFFSQYCCKFSWLYSWYCYLDVLLCFVKLVFTHFNIYSSLTFWLPSPPTEGDWTLASINAAVTVAMVSHAFVFHHNAFLMLASLDAPSRSRWSLIVHASVGFCLLLMLIQGVCGYVTFAGHIQGDTPTQTPGPGWPLNPLAPRVHDTGIHIKGFILRFFSSFFSAILWLSCMWWIKMEYPAKTTALLKVTGNFPICRGWDSIPGSGERQLAVSRNA